MWQGVGAFDKRGGGISQGLGASAICENVKKSNTLTMDEVHRNFNLTQ